MPSTSGTGNGSDESSSITNTLFTSPLPESHLLQTTRTMEEAWRRINLASLSSSARVPFDYGVPSNSMEISSSTAADPTSLNCNFPPPINRPILINPDQGLANSTPSLFGTGKKKRPQESDQSNSEDSRLKQRMIKNRESAARHRDRKQAYNDMLELEVERLKEENARIKRQHRLLQESSDAAASGQSKKHSHRRSSTAPF